MPKPAKKTGKKDLITDAAADEPEHSSGDANSEPELSPALAKALEIITEKISGAIDQKLGLREEVEGTDAVAFLQTWIPKFLHLQAKNGRIKIERAHRTLAPKPGAKDRPRPLIVRFHNYGDKQKVLDASRMLSRDGDLQYDDNKVSFSQDFSASVIRRHKEFNAVKQRLREMGARYAMLYPAKLRVSIVNTSKVFETVAAVLQYLDKNAASSNT
ncbi:hypothetical protein M9458_054215 [Cirrhinus mrigala]|uniref:L1 transposable element RRM domain-containing protein n=1 Tax=Cirrhinus mrigala TaxID=683832 RepID=A0ABD0MJR6_CIRMR